jgi:hypothetical protein
MIVMNSNYSGQQAFYDIVFVLVLTAAGTHSCFRGKSRERKSYREIT